MLVCINTFSYMCMYVYMCVLNRIFPKSYSARFNLWSWYGISSAVKNKTKQKRVIPANTECLLTLCQALYRVLSIHTVFYSLQ